MVSLKLHILIPAYQIHCIMSQLTHCYQVVTRSTQHFHSCDNLATTLSTSSADIISECAKQQRKENVLWQIELLTTKLLD